MKLNQVASEKYDSFLLSPNEAFIKLFGPLPEGVEGDLFCVFGKP